MKSAESLRRLLRRVAPRTARAVVDRLREGIAKPPVDDVVLMECEFAPDPDQPARLNLVIPYLTSATTFGGVTTGFEVVVALAREAGINEIRLIVTEPERATEPAIFTRAASSLGWPNDRVEIIQLVSNRQSIPVRAYDLFIAYNFWTALNTQPLLQRQASHFGRSRMPFLYLIQEYEPSLFEFSSAHMLAREAYDTTPRLWGVFNSTQLEAYFRLQGHRAERAFVFEPVISDALRPALDRVEGAARANRIVVYGRKSVDRNCFPALVRGLRRWAADYPEFADWQVVSAGTPHKPVALGDGRQAVSVGKLSLDDYADLMLGSRVGVSLMASPHPSYPPLEMAHMGLQTVTNTFTCKDLAGWHANIVSTASIAEEPLAAAIAQACRNSASPPVAAPNPAFVRMEKYPFIGELAADLRAELES